MTTLQQWRGYCDPGPTPPTAKLTAAVERFTAHYGVPPTQAVVHSSWEAVECAGLAIRTSGPPTVCGPAYYFLGGEVPV